jgi:hypothetical protein
MRPGKPVLSTCATATIGLHSSDGHGLILTLPSYRAIGKVDSVPSIPNFWPCKSFSLTPFLCGNWATASARVNFARPPLTRRSVSETARDRWIQRLSRSPANGSHGKSLTCKVGNELSGFQALSVRARTGESADRTAHTGKQPEGPTLTPDLRPLTSYLRAQDGPSPRRPPHFFTKQDLPQRSRRRQRRLNGMKIINQRSSICNSSFLSLVPPW